MQRLIAGATGGCSCSTLSRWMWQVRQCGTPHGQASSIARCKSSSNGVLQTPQQGICGGPGVAAEEVEGWSKADALLEGWFSLFAARTDEVLLEGIGAAGAVVGAATVGAPAGATGAAAGAAAAATVTAGWSVAVDRFSVALDRNDWRRRNPGEGCILGRRLPDGGIDADRS